MLNQQGYTVYEILNPVNFTGFIESSWIPMKENEQYELNKSISKVGNVEIILESVINRENDIYFNFDAIPFIQYKEGEFLYHGIINEDGTATSYFNINGFEIYNNKDIKIEVGQRGIGPDSKFSFGIDKDNYDLIAEGFTLEYQSSILYGYSIIN